MTSVTSCTATGSANQAIPETKSKITALSNPFDKGYEVFDIVEGNTDDNKYTDVDKTLKRVDSTTIIEFLGGFYKGDSHEGIIEYLDDENDKGSDGEKKITMKGKLNLIKSLVECASTKNLTNCPEEVANAIKILSAYFELYTNGELKDAKDFDRSTDSSVLSDAISGGLTGFGVCSTLGFLGSLASSTAIGAKLGCLGGPWGLAIGTVVGVVVGIFVGIFNKTTDDEIIDEQMKILYKYLTETEDKKTLNVQA